MSENPIKGQGEHVKQSWKIARQIKVNVYDLQSRGLDLFGGYWVEPFVIDEWTDGLTTLHIQSSSRENIIGGKQTFSDDQLDNKAELVAKQRESFIQLSPEEQKNIPTSLKSSKYSQWLEESRNVGIVDKIDALPK